MLLKSNFNTLWKWKNEKRATLRDHEEYEGDSNDDSQNDPSTPVKPDRIIALFESSSVNKAVVIVSISCPRGCVQDVSKTRILPVWNNSPVPPIKTYSHGVRLIDMYSSLGRADMKIT
jgi:hypothetical protein